MMESLQRWMSETSNAPFLEKLDNEQMMIYLTSPLGLAIAVVLVIIFVFLKQRIAAVLVTTIIAGIYVVRYTIKDTSGPNDTIFLFIGGAAALAGFIIYFTLMKEE